LKSENHELAIQSCAEDRVEEAVPLLEHALVEKGRCQCLDDHGTERRSHASQACKREAEEPAPGTPKEVIRVLVVHEFLPEYDRSGSEQRHWQVLQALRARGYAVTYVARHAINKDRYIFDLNKLGITAYAHDRERLAYLGISEPPVWSFEEVLQTGRFDVAFLLTWFWTGISIPEQYMDEIRRVSPHTRVIVVCDDPHGPREMTLAKLSGKLVDFERAKDFEQREAEIYPLADLVVTVSETNRQNLLAMSPNLQIEILPNEAESLVDPSPGLSFEARKDLLFLGDFLNFANRDGLMWFLGEVWPIVRRKLPRIKLNLAGSNQDSDFAKGFEGVERLGFVADLKPLFASHRIFISPARYGVSTRTKNLNALALGLPLVTTAAGAEGLYLRDGQEALLADTPVEFAEAIGRLYTDANLWQSLGDHGRTHIGKVFSRERLETALEEIIQRALSIHPKGYDPDHVWSAMVVERRFQELLDSKPGQKQMLLRFMCQLRLAEQFLREGDPTAAREQLRHVFCSVYGNLARTPIVARILLCLERCYLELGEPERALSCKEEAQLCLLPPQVHLSSTAPAPPAARHRKGRPRLSVVIPTCDRQVTLASCLRALDNQTLSTKEFEVIVVDDGSSDGTEALCRSFKAHYAFKYFRQANAGAGAARRLGVQHARGEYLLLFNDDTIASPNVLAKHLQTQKSHRREKLAVLGDFRYPPAASERALTYFLTRNPFLFPQVSLKPGVHSQSALFVTCNLSVSREAVLAAGSFDPCFRVAEDTDLGIRLMKNGFRVLYVPEALATHEHLPFRIGDLLRRAEFYAPAQLLLCRKHPEVLGDGSGPFGRLDADSILMLRAFVGRREREIEDAVRALERYDSLDFKPFFLRKVDDRLAADVVMEGFDQSIPQVYFFHLYRCFVKAWDEEREHLSVAASGPSFEEKEARI
jgi:glycosyltransferase involved in cell wall biosynthesis